MNKKIVFRWVKVFILVYSIIGIALYYGQEALLFHPVTMDRKAAWSFQQPFTELTLNYDKETQLNIVEFRATDRPADSLARGVLLYFPDARGNIARYASRATEWTARGTEVWMMDYPGFGKSTGSHKEADLYKYALIFYKLARSRWKPSEIELKGTGIGAAIAAQLASVRDCRQLYLENAWYSLDADWRKYFFLYPLGTLLHYHFPTHRYLPGVTAFVTLEHSDIGLRKFLKPTDEFTP